MRKLLVLTALFLLLPQGFASRGFNGSPDLITVPAVMGGPLDIYSTSMTVSLWAYPTEVGDAEHDLVAKWGSSSANQQFIVGFGLQLSGEGLYSIGTSIGPPFPLTGNYIYTGNSSTIVPNKWYNIIIYANVSNCTFGFNVAGGGFSSPTGGGENLQGCPDGNRSSSGQSLNIGGQNGGGDFKGMIAEVGIWNTALTAEEISSLQNGVSPTKIRRTALVGYLPLWGAASPEPDLSGNRNNGVLTGTTVGPHCLCGSPAAVP